MKRLFTFGCSFTQYWRWPTWADALGREYSHYENWGVCGAGNSLIFNSLIECYQRNHITANDDVYVMWTNTSREDRYVGRRWLAQGNIYWSSGNDLPIEYVKYFTCERGYLIRDLATITAARHLLEHWGCKWKFMSMVPLNKTNLSNELGSNPNDVLGNDLDVQGIYQDTLASIAPSIYSMLFKNNWSSRPGLPDANDSSRRDFHPTPLEHLEYFNLICPGQITRQDTPEWMSQCEQQAKTNSLRWSAHHTPEVRL
jgi:hypothetical protein